MCVSALRFVEFDVTVKGGPCPKLFMQCVVMLLVLCEERYGCEFYCLMACSDSCSGINLPATLKIEAGMFSL